METVRGTINGYKIGDISYIDIPIEDIEKFILHHVTGRNGLLIEAVIKSELISHVDVYSEEADEYGEVKRKYPINYQQIHIRMKDNYSFRKKLYNLLMKQDVKEQRMGMNAGTPCAICWTVKWKEIKPSEVFI